MRFLPKSLAHENYVKGLAFMCPSAEGHQPFTQAMLEHAWPYISAERPLSSAAIWPEKLPVAAALAAIRAGICQVRIAAQRTLAVWYVCPCCGRAVVESCLAAVPHEEIRAGPGSPCMHLNRFGTSLLLLQARVRRYSLPCPAGMVLQVCGLTFSMTPHSELGCDAHGWQVEFACCSMLAS